ncbi:MAG: nucleotidyltransferase family protein [Lachnospiraceae bacterium]
MKHIGIIAEYNPFHNGHAYQINTIKQIFPEKDIAVIMSGNYVQRGEPAIFNKYVRASMALSYGADLIIELPAIFSCSSAEYFATAALLSLAATGVIDTLCFGAECDDTILYDIADILEQEPLTYKIHLQKLLVQGMSFPKARSAALSKYMNHPDIDEILKKPNNILAIEYMKAIKHYNLPIKPFILKRSHDNYHSTDTEDSICSATALRQRLKQTDSSVSKYIPDTPYHVLLQDKYNKPVYFEDFYPLIQQSILSKSDFSRYQDISKDFSNRLNSYRILPYNIYELQEELTHKNITGTRVSRCLMHILLNHEKSVIKECKENNYVSYIRLLGFRKQSALPRLLKKHATLPVITKVASYEKLLSKQGQMLFNQQIQADDYYRQIYFNKYHEKIPSEYEHSVIIYE